MTMQSVDSLTKETATFKPAQPREKWLKRRTTIKLRVSLVRGDPPLSVSRFYFRMVALRNFSVCFFQNVAPNHRANDVIILEDKPQILTARFMYGPLDMVSLSGEKVSLTQFDHPQSGSWSWSLGRKTPKILWDILLINGFFHFHQVQNCSSSMLRFVCFFYLPTGRL